MNKGFIFSNRLLYATLFSVVVIGGAVYLSKGNTQTPLKTPDLAKEAATETHLIQEDDATKEQSTTTSQAFITTVPEASEPLATTSALSTSTPLTETDILTRNILKPYIEQSQNDTYSKENAQKIINEATKKMFVIDYTPLEPKDITTKEDSSTTSIKIYKDTLGEAVNPLLNLTEYELTLYAKAIRDNNKDLFIQLSDISHIYKDTAQKVLEIPTPNEISAVHLNIINSLSQFSAVLESLSKGYDDPAASLAGMGNFTKAEEAIGQAFNKLETYLILKGVK